MIGGGVHHINDFPVSGTLWGDGGPGECEKNKEDADHEAIIL
jgi:hypothetical protein